MKKAFYLPFLTILFLAGCSSDDGGGDPVKPDPDPEPPIVESYYEIPAALEDYYADVDFNLEEDKLHEELAVHTIEKHTDILGYGSRHQYLYNADADFNNSGNVVLIYTGESRDKREYQSGSNSYSPQTFNTEHVYPQSMLEGDAIADLHILRVVDIEVNELRMNYPYTDGEGQYKLVQDNSFYPGDEWRGDVARMVMYMNLRYDEPFEPVGGLELFLEWNAEDPVSAFEMQRNEVIEDAQGNRNPFIDNPHLATRIWGGEEADNRWDGEAEEADEEAPSIPQNVTVDEVSFETVDLTWEASSDNVGVAKYNVMVDGDFYTSVTSTSLTVEGLEPGVTYEFTVSAADSAGNTSDASDVVEGTTTADDEAPSVPQNLSVSAVSVTSVTLTWDASTDNAAVAGYDIYINGEFYQTVSTTEYTLAGLDALTTYSFAVKARDIYGNTSELSASTDVTTKEETDENAVAADILISEYTEGEWGFNKALEIGNPTAEAVDLSTYTLMKITNEKEDWENEFQLEGTLAAGEVLVIVNDGAEYPGLLDAADVLTDHQIVNFNGNDPVGLFKDGVLIDMIGFKGGEVFAADVNLRRKSSITKPNTTFTIDEWETYDDEETEGYGSL